MTVFRRCRRSAKRQEQRPNFLGEQRQCFRWRDILDIMHVPIDRQTLPFSEPFSHEWSMFSFFDRNQEIGAGQIVDGTLPREPIGAARSNRHLLKGVQRERRNRADVVCPTFQGETA